MRKYLRLFFAYLGESFKRAFLSIGKMLVMFVVGALVVVAVMMKKEELFPSTAIPSNITGPQIFTRVNQLIEQSDKNLRQFEGLVCRGSSQPEVECLIVGRQTHKVMIRLEREVPALLLTGKKTAKGHSEMTFSLGLPVFNQEQEIKQFTEAMSVTSVTLLNDASQSKHADPRKP